MKTAMQITLRRFPVTVRDELTGEVSQDTIVFDKETLSAAQRVGQSSRELICRAYDRECFKVLEIGKAEKKTVTFSLDALFEGGTGEGA